VKKSLGVLLFVVTGFVFSCKSSYTKTGDKNANYIPYYLKVYEADSLFLTNNFERSYQILDSLFKEYEPLCMNNYAEYSIYLGAAIKSGNVENIAQKVRYGVSHFGGIVALHKENFDMYDELLIAANLTEEEVSNLEKEYYNNLNLELRDEMIQMFKDDQAIRNNDDINIEEMQIIDRNNRIKLEAIFDEYGYPSDDLVGTDYTVSIKGEYVREVILLIHQDKGFKEKYLPFLLDNVKRGKCDPSIYAMVYDRMMLDSLGKQYFGSYDCSYGKCKLLNPEIIDSIRMSVGLPNLNYYEWRLQQFRKE